MGGSKLPNQTPMAGEITQLTDTTNVSRVLAILVSASKPMYARIQATEFGFNLINQSIVVKELSTNQFGSQI